VIQPLVFGPGVGGEEDPPAVAMVYDYRDRMVEYVDPQAGERHVYRYDALGRRIVRVVDADSAEPEVTCYFYAGSRVIEEQDGDGVTQATYVYGLYVDEVLTMRRAGTFAAPHPHHSEYSPMPQKTQTSDGGVCVRCVTLLFNSG